MSARKIKRIVVAVKPRERGLPLAAYHARVLAQRLGADLTIVTAVHEPSLATRLTRDEEPANRGRSALMEAEKLGLEKLAESLRDWGVPVVTEVLWHAPAYEAILEVVAEQRADLLIVGAHAPQPIMQTRLTDTDWQLLRLCPCPVLFVKDLAFASYETVLAAIDPLYGHAEPEGTDRAVLGVAAAFATAFGSELRTVHAYPDPAQYSLLSAVEVSPGVFYGAEHIEAVHREAVRELVSQFGVEPDDIDLRPGDPRRVIIEAAADQGANLLVLGALKRGRFEQAMLGSTAETVIADAECDVLVVRAPAES